jgi:hypothetical protein
LLVIAASVSSQSPSAAAIPLFVFLFAFASRQPSHLTRGGEEKNKNKAAYRIPTYFFGDFLRFFYLILENICVVFLSSSCRETVKNAIKKIKGEKRQEKSFFSLNFFAKKNRHGLPPKSFMVFLNSPC